MKNLLILFLFIGFFTSCNQSEETTESSDELAETEELDETIEENSINDEVHLKVLITESGEIKADGEPTTLEELDPLLNDLSAKKGVVYYHRDHAYQGDIWEDVMDLIASYELPIAMYTDAEFTQRLGL